MSFNNKTWFPNNSNFTSNFNSNNVNMWSTFPPPTHTPPHPFSVLPGVMGNPNLQYQRCPQPRIRAPATFPPRPPFPATNERHPFPTTAPQFFAPRNLPFVSGPRMPSGPLMHLPYSGHAMNQISQKPLRFQSPRHPIPQGTTPWNQKLWNNSSKNKQWEVSRAEYIQKSTNRRHSDFHKQPKAYTPPPNKFTSTQRTQNRVSKLLKSIAVALYKIRKDDFSIANVHEIQLTLMDDDDNLIEMNQKRPWMTDEIYQEVKRKNALYAEAKATGNCRDSKQWQELRIQRKKVATLIREAKVHCDPPLLKIKEEDFIMPLPFLCDTCDRAFAEESKLNKHFKEHIKCNQDGCQFEAHPKVVVLHRKMQHETGYAKAILKLGNPEEIKKWREERKRRFPTAQNIKQRQEENAEKTARGEIIETKDFGKFKKQKFDYNTHAKPQGGRGNHRFNRNRHQRDQPRRQRNRVEKRVHAEVDSDDDSHIRLPRFKGMQAAVVLPSEEHDEPVICNGLHDQSGGGGGEEHTALSDANKQEADSCSDIVNEQLSKPGGTQSNGMEQNVHNCVPSSECMPSFTDVTNDAANDSDDSAPAVLPIMKSSENECSVHFDDNDSAPAVLAIMKSCGNLVASSDNDRAPGILKSREYDSPFLASNMTQVEKKNPNSVQTCSSSENLKEHSLGHDKEKRASAIIRNNYFHSPRRNSLLEKLLAKEISHERNVIYQCVRYIVDKNFFGVHSD